jgi:lipopolysaccharide transport system permease protein
LGFLWAFIQPFGTMAILIFVFDKTLHVKTEDIPYPLHAMAGMMLWTYFGFVLQQSGTSIISSQSIISKVYFPRLILPLSKAFVGLIDFFISFLMLVALFIFFRFPLSPQMIYAPLFILLAMLASLGTGILFSSVSVRYRDFQYVMPFVLQVGLYITPIAYPTTFISEKWKWVYFLNPMAGIIEGLRWSIFDRKIMDPYCYVSFFTTFLILLVGLFFFMKTESKMADLV